MSTKFDKLGAGTIASVFAIRSRCNVAIKLLACPSRSLELEKEFKDLQNLYNHFKVQGLICLPEPYEHYDGMFALGKDMDLEEGFDISPLQDASLYTMERIWLLPRQFSELIQTKFFHPMYKVGLYKFIAQIYVGQELSPQPRIFFNKDNFPLGIDRLQELGLPIAQLAHDMGLMLGSINFVGLKDGYGIEFVVGGDGFAASSKLQYYCIDFNKMSDHDGIVSNLVKSYFGNISSYPCPGMSHWLDFKTGYLKVAIGKYFDLAEEVIASIEDKYPPIMPPSKDNGVQDDDSTTTKRTKKVHWSRPLVTILGDPLNTKFMNMDLPEANITC